jgi:hypothetical protein
MYCSSFPLSGVGEGENADCLSREERNGFHGFLQVRRDKARLECIIFGC